jgi:hypothetical protein
MELIMMSQNVGKEIICIISQTSADFIYIMAEDFYHTETVQCNALKL